MERKTYTVAQLIEKLKEMPQDALVIGYGRPDGYAAIDYVECFDSSDIRTSVLKQSVTDSAIIEHKGDFVYMDNMLNLFP